VARKRTQTLLIEMLLWIGSQQRRIIDEINNNSSSNLYNKVYTTFPIADEKALDNLFRSGDQIEMIDRGYFLYLWPITKGGYYLPIMTLKYDFVEENSEARFRVALFCLHGDQPKASAYRFETSEGKGKHDYCHAQLITSFAKHKYPLPCEEWLPVDQPAFCLDAKEPISLLMNLLISLYGFEYVTALIGPKFASDLAPYLKDIGWFKKNPRGLQRE